VNDVDELKQYDLISIWLGKSVIDDAVDIA